MFSKVAGRLRRQDSSPPGESHASPSSVPPSPAPVSHFAPPPDADGAQVPTSALQIEAEPHPGLDDLPMYLGQGQAPDARTLHSFNINLPSGRVTLRVRSQAGPAQLFPLSHNGSALEGEVEMVLTSSSSVHSVVLGFEGTTKSLGFKEKTFLSYQISLWPKEATTASHKLEAGTYIWPFSLTVPHTARLSWGNEQIVTAICPTFCLRGQVLSDFETLAPAVEYTLKTVVNIGTFRQDYVLPTLVTLVPRSRPKPSSILRQAAYASRMPSAGPENDPEGWTSCSGPISGVLFSIVTLHMDCTLHLAAPLCYTRGTYIPLTMTFSSENTQALDLFALPSSIKIHLEQRFRLGVTPKTGRSTEAYTKVMKNVVAEGRCATSKESGPEWRRLDGELRIPRNLKPSFSFVRCSLTYYIVLAVDCVGFVPAGKADHALVLEQEVAIATDRPRGVRQPPSILFPGEDGGGSTPKANKRGELFIY